MLRSESVIECWPGSYRGGNYCARDCSFNRILQGIIHEEEFNSIAIIITRTGSHDDRGPRGIWVAVMSTAIATRAKRQNLNIMSEVDASLKGLISFLLGLIDVAQRNNSNFQAEWSFSYILLEQPKMSVGIVMTILG